MTAKPPSTGIATPVTKEDFSDASHRTPAAISSGLVILFKR